MMSQMVRDDESLVVILFCCVAGLMIDELETLVLILILDGLMSHHRPSRMEPIHLGNRQPSILCLRLGTLFPVHDVTKGGSDDEIDPHTPFCFGVCGGTD